MSKDGGGYSGDEGVALVSLASQVRTLKIQIEGYKQHIQIAEKSYKEHTKLLKAKVQMNIHNSAFNGLLTENSELKAQNQIMREALGKILMVALPPNDISGRDMWNEAQEALEKIKEKYEK